jgi:hypothetical protein
MGLGACTSTTPATACLTRADCTATAECIAGRCVSAALDSGRNDAGSPSDAGDASVEADAQADDAMVADDAFAREDAFVEVDAGPPPPGDSCSDAISLALDSGGHGHAEGELGVFRHDHATYCNAPDAPDVVYVIDIPPGAHDIEVRTVGDGATDTVVAMSEACRGDDFYSCHDDRAPGVHDTRMILHRYSPTQVFILVGGFANGDVGHFSLDVDVTAVADTSTCATPIDLTGGAFVVAWGATTDAAPHPSCLTTTPVVSDVYALHRDAEMFVDSLDAYFGDVQGAITLVDSCTAPITEPWCALSTWVDSRYFGLGVYSMPFQTPDLGYLVVTAGAASESYSFSFYP